MTSHLPPPDGSPAAAGGPSGPVIEVVHLSKRFGATQALDDVSLALFRGEVHGFAGENGAGKSTLGKIIAGVYHTDSGEVLVDGEPVGKWDTGRAQRRGVVLIAQELSLVPELTVEQNVFLGVEQHVAGVLRPNLRQRFDALEATCGFGLNPEVKVATLSIADQQKVEIMRALARDARVIIMDEPTSSLTPDEVEKLHVVIARLASQGRTVVYVTHFLEALLSVSDRVTVMRDGRLVKTVTAAGQTQHDLVEAMLGRSLTTTFPERTAGPGADVTPKLELREVSTAAGIRDVSLIVRPGEVVGLAGLVGSGRTEIARAVFGADAITGGRMWLDGKELTAHTPRDSIRAGVVMIPESRRDQGLIMVRSVRENISLPHLRLLSRFGRLKRRREQQVTTQLVKQVAVSPPRINAFVSDFSGGNQQKVLFAKWLLGNPSLIIFDEPTRGVDIGAKVKLYEIIADLAAQGAAVLLISSEHEEVLALSHRMYLVRDRTIIGEMDPATTSVDQLLFGLFGLSGETSTPKEPAS